MNADTDIPQGTMPPALLIVDAVIATKVEHAWNEWYNKEHLPEILACPHFITAARYVSEQDGARRYVAVYALSSTEAVSTPEFAKVRGWSTFKDDVTANTRLYTRVPGGNYD